MKLLRPNGKIEWYIEINLFLTHRWDIFVHEVDRDRQPYAHERLNILGNVFIRPRRF
jgi:hypothetical protein